MILARNQSRFAKIPLGVIHIPQHLPINYHYQTNTNKINGRHFFTFLLQVFQCFLHLAGLYLNPSVLKLGVSFSPLLVRRALNETPYKWNISISSTNHSPNGVKGSLVIQV